MTATPTPTSTVPSACGQVPPRVEHQPCAVGCLGDCDYLGMVWGDPDDRAKWHERAVAFLASPALAEMTWFLDELAAVIEGGEEAPGVRLLDLEAFVAEHNWPDPVGVVRFQQALHFLAIQRVQRAAQLGRWV